MKKLYLVLALLLLVPSFTFAAPPSLNGGEILSAGQKAHNVGVGWPSAFYEWWNGGRMNWALGGELVYGDWSGEHSDVDIGFAMNLPLKWHLAHRGKVDAAFRFAPGFLIADAQGPGSTAVFGIRGEMGVPVSIAVDPKVSILTGVNSPTAVYFTSNGYADFVFPILFRVGAAVSPISEFTAWFAVDFGPVIAHIRNFGTDTTAGIRGFFGVSWF